MRPPATALLLAFALAPAAATAQAFDGTQGVDTFTGPVVSPSRILGLGGAYVAVAEGLGGAASNPAAVAQRSRTLARGWDWDWLLTWYVPQPGEVGRQDLGNDGRVDSGLSGVGNGQLGLSLQRGRLGVGIVGGGWTLAAARDGVGWVDIEAAQVSYAVGASLLQDAFVVGASVTQERGVVRVAPAGAAPVAIEYAASTIRLGALARPRGRPWRLGLALDLGATAGPRGDRAALPVATPANFVFPWVVSVGAAGWLGPNAERLNEPPAVELERHPELGPGPAWEESPRRPVLVSAQLDVVGPAPGAVAMESALVPSDRPQPSGRRPSAVVRAGVEWEPRPERLRVRGGAYVEPARVAGASARPHATFGVDLRVPFLVRDLQLGLSGDVAARFQNVSLTLAFWSSVGPTAPASSVAANRS